MVTGVHHLVGPAEIGIMLGGISRQRVQQLVTSDGFPEPEVNLAMGKVWKRSDVASWAAEHGRDISDAPHEARPGS